MTAPPTLVVLRALGLGDALTAVPALRALADAFPGHRRLLAMPAPLAPIMRLAFEAAGDGGRAGGGGFDVVDVRGLGPLPPALHGADVAVNLHGRGPQSHRALLGARPRRLVAFACPEAGVAEGPRWRRDEHEVGRWCRLLSECGIPADPARLAIAAPEPPSGVPPAATLIHPGAGSGARRWPWRRWAEVARREIAAGRDVVVSGSAAETSLAAAVVREAGLSPRAVLAGRTDLVGLAGAVAAAGRVACGDTGVAHLATALGRPSVVVFGPASPLEWGPPPDGRHVVLWSGRGGDPHADRPHPGLLEIGVEEVASALAALGCGPLDAPAADAAA